MIIHCILLDWKLLIWSNLNKLNYEIDVTELNLTEYDLDFNKELEYEKVGKR